MVSRTHTVHLLAHVPQVRIAGDTYGAEAISCLNWAMFAFANVSTASYALLAIDDALMAWLFTANFAACLMVLGLTAWKRVQAGRRRA